MRERDGDRKIKMVKEQEKQHGENCQLTESKQTVTVSVKEKRQAFF